MRSDLEEVRFRAAFFYYLHVATGSQPRSWAGDRTFARRRLAARFWILLPPRRPLVPVPIRGQGDFTGLFFSFCRQQSDVSGREGE
ncbi:hypothetical protein NDU88_008127 [Pleurodeles waltl]|uniref:Uncharacterized protein n=1 Tax=Pleurodeles waltl TaxID=8319 RepID=A0AAV7SUT1_PLEWA|nr:hypothetical protein NDU88_008127 [Pleurodeles waltl]